MNNNRVIICLHGYGKRRGIQFKALVDALGNKYNFVCVDYFTLNENDINYKDWLDRAETVFIENKDKEIIVIGFSLGAVIGSYFANKYNVKKMIFIGASFEYDYFLRIKKASPEKVIPIAYLDTFVDVVDNCADSIYEVNCPVTYIHAKGDEIIPYELSVKYCEKTKKGKLISLDGGQHMLFDNELLKDKTIEIIDSEISELI